MPARWLVIVSWISLTVAVGSAARILTDIYARGHRLKMPVMEAVWPATALYLGPVGVWAYLQVRSCHPLRDGLSLVASRNCCGVATCAVS